MGIAVYKNEDLKIVIQNIVAISDLEADLNLNEVAMGRGLENVEYEPEQFPGLVYRIEEPKVAMLLIWFRKNCMYRCQKNRGYIYCC